SSIDFTFQTQKPATSSFVSANGPSTTVRLLPSKRTRLALDVGCSPSPESITPAFTSSSLNFVIFSRSSRLGITPASDSALPGTRTMTRIVVLLVVFPAYTHATNEPRLDRQAGHFFPILQLTPIRFRS